MIALALAVLLAAPAPPSRVGPSDLDGDGATDAARLEARGDALWLIVETASGTRAELVLGESELPFQLDGRESRLTIRDVNGDGRAEVIVAASAAQRGLLYVLRLDGRKLRSLHPEAEAFVSETGAYPDAFAVDSQGRITIASVEHSEDGPQEALFTFEFRARDKGYRLTATDRATDD